MPARISPRHNSLFFDACWDQPQAWCTRSFMPVGISPGHDSLFFDTCWDQHRIWCTSSVMPAGIRPGHGSLTLSGLLGSSPGVHSPGISPECSLYFMTLCKVVSTLTWDTLMFHGLSWILLNQIIIFFMRQPPLGLSLKQQ